MKHVAIIGGGWVGCHLARTLSRNVDVTLYERNDTLISETSLINQNRLHYGYHYARNAHTRELCRDTFQIFLRDYGHIVDHIPNNLYAVAQDESLLDSTTLRHIFKDWPYTKVRNHGLRNTSLVINTQEKFINAGLAAEYFSQLLMPLVVRADIKTSDIPLLKKDFDYVIDCTNNALLSTAENCFFEEVMMMLYSIKKPLPFGALTYIDGELFSLYPYQSGVMSLSHVKHGVISQSTVHPGRRFNEQSYARRMAMENHLRQYWSELEDYLSPLLPVTSVKAKVRNNSADRAPVSEQDDNLLSVFTGKIQGIYAIEALVKAFIHAA